MELLIHKKVYNFLDKQFNGDPAGVRSIRKFFKEKLEPAENPTALSNCKKIQGTKNTWRWRIKQYRIIGEVYKNELLIKIIEISTRQDAYK